MENSNNNVGNNSQNNSKRNTRIFLVVLLLMLISIGYAVLSSTLKINGKADIKAATFDVHFDNVQITKGIGTSIEKTKAVIDPNDDTTVNFAVALNIPGDEYEFTVDVVNSGDIDAMIKTLNPINVGDAASKYLDVTVTYANGSAIQQGDGLNSKNKHTYKVKVKYRNDAEAVLPTSDVKELEFSFNAEYVQNNGTAVDKFPKVG